MDFAIQDLFEMYGEDQDLYYDFSKPLEAPSCTIQFSNMRMLQNLCLLPNFHVLIEGGLLDQCVEVYELQDSGNSLEEPILIIQTGCRGLNAIDFSEF